ncbi:flagellar biosynthetic protein FliO [Candidatus Latescibacterota bacterium]
MSYMNNSIVQNIIGAFRGLFCTVSYILSFMLFLPARVYSAEGAQDFGAVSGDSLVSYSNSLNSDINLFVRFIFALAIVLILLILTLWFLKYIMKLRNSGGAHGEIDVLEIRYIEPKKAIAIVRVLNRVMIIGLAENSITALGDLSSEEIGKLNLDKKTDPGIFGNILSKYKEKKSQNG